MIDISSKFAQGIEKRTYQRIDPTYTVDIYLGYNEQGEMSMVIAEYGKNVRVKSSRMIGVQITKRDDGKLALCFSLKDNSYSAMFTLFCQDVIISCEKSGKSLAIAKAISRWKYWLELFGRQSNSILDVKTVQGLMGELIALKTFFIPQYGVHKAVESWMGPLMGHKDFEVKNTWYEVKTTKSGANKVEISSIEQLESAVDGHLMVMALDYCNSASNNAIHLNSLVSEIVRLLEDPDDSSLFFDKLTQIGYFANPEYEDHCFSFNGTNLYLVNSEFPRIKREIIPLAIGNVAYTIMLNAIGSFQEERE